MIKVKYLDNNKNFVKSLDLKNGFSSILFSNKINEPRALKITVNNNLGYDYDRIVKRDDYFLELNIDGKKILFAKETTNFNYFEAIGTKGQGTTENDGLFVLNNLSGDSKFISVNINGKYYLKNTTYSNSFNRFKIKNFDNVITQKYLNTRANSYCNYYTNNIKKQIDKDDGISEISFLSTSSLEIDWSKRLFQINRIFTGYLSEFLTYINPNVNWVLVSNDLFIDNLDTGSSDNRELLEEVCKALGISWAEVDCVNGITTINIGDHIKQSEYKNVNNFIVNHDYYNSSCRIKRLTNYYPTITTKIECKKIIQEGTLFLAEYKKNIKNIGGDSIDVYRNKVLWSGVNDIEIKELLYVN